LQKQVSLPSGTCFFVFRSLLSGTRRGWHTERFANTSCRPFLDLDVTGDWRVLSGDRIYPDVVFATVVTEVTALITQVFLELCRFTLSRQRLIRQFGAHIVGAIRAVLECVTGHFKGFFESLRFGNQLRF
jgi:hypothetical protein